MPSTYRKEWDSCIIVVILVFALMPDIPEALSLHGITTRSFLLSADVATIKLAAFPPSVSFISGVRLVLSKHIHQRRISAIILQTQRPFEY